MTAALICDGCSDVMSTRGDDTREWITVDLSAVPGNVPMFASIDLTIDDGTLPEVEPTTYEPPFHFCSAGCLAVWADARADR